MDRKVSREDSRDQTDSETGFGLETHEILRRIIDATGDRRLSRLLGYLDRSTIHRQARPTPATGGADATGSRNVLDRFAVLAEEARRDPVAYEALRLWTLEQFGEEAPAAPAPDELREHADALIRGLARLYVQPARKDPQGSLNLPLMAHPPTRTERVLELIGGAA